jgi:hypothetical protein
MPPVVIAAGIGAAGMLASSAIGSSAAKKAAETQTQAATDSANVSQQISDAQIAAAERARTENLGVQKDVLANSLAAQTSGANRLLGDPTVSTGLTVRELFQKILGRNPTDSELAAWEPEIGGNVNANAITKFLNAVKPEIYNRGLTPPTLDTIIAGTPAAGLYATQNAKTLGDLTSAYNTQRSDLTGAYDTQRSDLTGAYDTQRSDLTGAYDTQMGVMQPYAQAGINALGQYQNLLGLGGNTGAQGYGKYATAEFTPAQFAAGQDPGYAFRISEGLKALDKTAAARGGLLSGAALKGATTYGQGMASDEYQNAFNRYQTSRANTLAPLQGLAASGQDAAGAIANIAGTYGQNMSNVAGTYGQNMSNVAGTYGQNMGNVAGTYGQNMGNVAGAYGTNLALANQTYGANVGNAVTGNAANLANIYSNYGGAVSGNNTALAASTGNALAGYGTGYTNAITSAANATSAGQIAGANMATAGIGNALNLAGQYFGNNRQSAYATPSYGTYEYQAPSISPQQTYSMYGSKI